MHIDLSYFSNLLKISEGELRRLIEEKKKKFYNLIDDEVALLLVLKDFGINIKSVGKWKIRDLFYGLKISEISVVIGKKIIEKENLLVYDIYDDTGKIKLIYKGDIKKVKNILIPGKVIRIKNSIVLRNKTLSLFVNNPKQIEEEKNEEIIDSLLKVSYVDYVSEFYGKVLKREENYYYVLTDNFGVLKLKSDIYLESKTYHFKAYLGKSNKIFYASEVDFDRLRI